MPPRSHPWLVLKDALSIARKDLRVELRSKEILLTTGYFGFLVVLVFSFSFFRGDAPVAGVAAGSLWVALAFAGSLGLGRVYERERAGDCLRALLLSPIARPAIFLGKLAGILSFMLVVEAVVLVALVFFFNLSLDMERLLLLVLLLSLGTLGYGIIGGLLGAMLQRAQAKDVLLSILLYPLVLPVLIVGVKATTTLLLPEPLPAALWSWLQLLLVFDLVFMVAALWIFEALLIE